jgi:hypothetical protein
LYVLLSPLYFVLDNPAHVKKVGNGYAWVINQSDHVIPMMEVNFTQPYGKKPPRAPMSQSTLQSQFRGNRGVSNFPMATRDFDEHNFPRARVYDSISHTFHYLPLNWKQDEIVFIKIQW